MVTFINVRIKKKSFFMMNIPSRLYDAINLVNLDDEKFIQKMMDIGLLNAGPVHCPQCNLQMHLCHDQSVSDNVSWKCPNNRCRRSKSVREGTVFYGKKYPIKTLYLIYCYWCADFPIYEIAQLIGIGDNTHPIQNLCREFRQAAIQKYQLDLAQNPLGGPNTVEVDESAFGKAKHHRGRALKRNCNWVIGAFEQNTRRVAVSTMPNRSMAIINPFIGQNISPGSTIYTDEWRAYNGLNNNGYVHKKVNHKKGFVRILPTGECVNTNLAEGNWTPVKGYLDKHHAHHRKYTDEYVKTWGYRRNIVHSYQNAMTTLT